MPRHAGGGGGGGRAAGGGGERPPAGPPPPPRPRRAGQVPTRPAGESGGRERLSHRARARGGTFPDARGAVATHTDSARCELRDRPVGPDARLVYGARRGRGLAAREPGDSDRDRRIHRQHRDEVLEPAVVAVARGGCALLPRAQRRDTGPHGGEGVRRLRLHRAQRHRRRASAEPSGGAAQAAVAAAGGASVCSPAPMLRPLLILCAVAIATVPAVPAAVQQPRRTPPPRRRPPPVTARGIPTPRSVLGFEPGDDRKLADWPTLLRYYQALAAASDRVRYRELGHSTLGAPLIALVISSPQNLRALDRYRALNAKLADPRGFKTARETDEALRDGKAIVLVTSGIHSTEVGGHLTPALLAYRLASDTSLATRTILDNVILWLVPSLNPDGVSIVTRWYNRTVGTAAEGSEPPELYHHYVGHDNNRDWYAFTQVETQLVVDSLHNVWHPQIVHDIHQQDTDGSRLFLPPYLDPVEPNVDPLLVDGVNALGASVAWELGGEGKTGTAINAIYDAWTPARAYQHYHGGVRILSEAASANLASPLDLPADQLATRGRGFNPRERSWNFTNPWQGGRWTLRDIVAYQTDGAYALLENAARYRDRWLATFLTGEGRAVRGGKGWPYAYVMPRQHQDSVGVATLLGILHRGQVEIRTALHPVALGGQRFPAGSYVVVLRQPYAGFAKTLLEPQRYPDLRLYAGGPPLPPYDVTAHTLPLLMGVTAVPARDSLRI